MNQPLSPEQKKIITATMHEALKDNDRSLIEITLKKGADATDLMFEGIRKKDLSLIKLAVQYGADVHASRADNKNDGNQPAFHWIGIDYFNKEVAEYFLSQGVSVDVRSAKNNTPLKLAIREKKWHQIFFYARHGADPLVVCDGGETPLEALNALKKDHPVKWSWNNGGELLRILFGNTEDNNSPLPPEAAPVAVEENSAAPDPGTKIAPPAPPSQGPCKNFGL